MDLKKAIQQIPAPRNRLFPNQAAVQQRSQQVVVQQRNLLVVAPLRNLPAVVLRRRAVQSQRLRRKRMIHTMYTAISQQRNSLMINTKNSSITKMTMKMMTMHMMLQ